MNELIAKYFENTLSDTDKVLFEKQILEDDTFKSEFEFQKELQKSIQVSERQKIKSSLQQFEKPKVIMFNLKRLYPYVAILVLFFSLWIIFKNDSNTQDLYTEYFSMYPNVVEPISRSSNEKSLKQEAFENYELGNYNKALFDFEVLKTSNESDRDIINIYKANIYLYSKNPEKAIIILKENLEESNEWMDKNLWYLSLAYLKLGNSKKAKETLLLLSKETNNFKKQETLSLLNSLK
jgi:hypothetical protein